MISFCCQRTFCGLLSSPEEIRGKKRLNLATDPPPDLIVEIDVTHDSLDRLPIFATVGVQEVWRYENETVKIYRLNRNSYTESEESSLLPGVTATVITQFANESRSMRRFEWIRKVRDWASSLSNQSPNNQPENQ